MAAAEGEARGLVETQRRTLPADWIDDNGHLNDAWYLRLFSDAIEGFMAAMGMDRGYRRRTETSTYTLEAHLAYLREVEEGAEVVIRTRVLDLADKTFILHHAMHRGDDDSLLATCEHVMLHVDMRTRRGAALPDSLRTPIATALEAQRSLPEPARRSRAFSLRKG